MTELGGDLARLPGAHRAALLDRVKAAGRRDVAELRPRPRTGPAPLSYAQEPLWFLERLAPGRSTYNIPAGFRLVGPLDVTVLRAALADVVARHETLRTSLHEEGGEGVQRVHDEIDVDVDLPIIAPSGASPEERLSTARELAEAAARQPFDFAQAPLWRARLYRVDSETHLLVFVIHHVVCDGWSLGVFARDLAAFYRARTGDATPADLPALPVQYPDYAGWQREWLSGGVHDDLAAYWREKLAGLPVLEFPTDRPRPAHATFGGASLRRSLDRAVIDDVQALAAAEKVSPHAVYLAAFLVLLHRYTGQDDLVIGSPTANRGRVEVEPLIGFFVNMLVLRTDVSGDPSVRELIARVHAVVQDAIAHGELPFEKVVDAVRPPRDPARSPLFQISFGLPNSAEPPQLPGVRAVAEHFDLDSSRFDMSWNLHEEPEALGVQVEYNTELFDRQSIETLMNSYEQILRAGLSDTGAPISRLPLLTAAERDELLHRWNGPQRPVPPVTIPELFQQRVRQSPAAVALVVGGEQITYDALNRRANRLARLLAEHGVTPGDRVALCLPRERDLIVSVLAVLKAGAAYVPVDAAYPPARMSAVLSDAAPAVVLTHTTLADRLPADGPEALVLDRLADRLSGYPDGDPEGGPAPGDVAYVIYTSGTTGRPKGVLIEHHSVIGFIAAVTELFELTADDRILGFASMNFDVSVFEMFSALLTGARLCLARDDERVSMDDLQRLMEHTGVTVTDLPPAVMALLDSERFTSLRIVFLGGEAFTGDLVNRWRPGRRLFNGYGPTECTVTMVVYECDGDWQLSPPIGLPMANHVAHVVDRQFDLVPYGVAGELVIGGEGLTRGYLNAPDLTRQKIVPDPFGTARGGRLYHTGDLVKRQRDGNIVFLGRIDKQVKIRGLRIELGEIETVLATHPDVGQVAVQPWTDERGDKHLVAYVSPHHGARPDIAALRNHVAEQLPRYMVPPYVVLLDSLPLTVSGKVDARSLPAPDESARPGAGGAEPTTETQRVLAVDILGDLLGMSHVGIHDNFFELGGNSLQATQLMSRIRDRFGVEVSLADFFQMPTVAQLAEVVDRSKADAMSDEELLALVARMPEEQTARLLESDGWAER
jgi:amino acid adenylation domain-containing protein